MCQHVSTALFLTNRRLNLQSSISVTLLTVRVTVCIALIAEVRITLYISIVLSMGYYSIVQYNIYSTSSFEI